MSFILIISDEENYKKTILKNWTNFLQQQFSESNTQLKNDFIYTRDNWYLIKDQENYSCLIILSHWILLSLYKDFSFSFIIIIFIFYPPFRDWLHSDNAIYQTSHTTFEQGFKSIYLFKLKRYFFQQSVWKVYWMKFLRLGLKWKLLIYRCVEFRFVILIYILIFWFFFFFNFEFFLVKESWQLKLLYFAMLCMINLDSKKKLN